MDIVTYLLACIGAGVLVWGVAYVVAYLADRLGDSRRERRMVANTIDATYNTLLEVELDLRMIQGTQQDILKDLAHIKENL